MRLLGGTGYHRECCLCLLAGGSQDGLRRWFIRVLRGRTERRYVQSVRYSPLVEVQELMDVAGLVVGMVGGEGEAEEMWG